MIVSIYFSFFYSFPWTLKSFIRLQFTLVQVEDLPVFFSEYLANVPAAFAEKPSLFLWRLSLSFSFLAPQFHVTCTINTAPVPARVRFGGIPPFPLLCSAVQVAVRCLFILHCYLGAWGHPPYPSMCALPHKLWSYSVHFESYVTVT